MKPGGRLLVMDTASEALSVALFADGVLIGHHHEIAGRGHAEKLIPAIAALPEGGRAQEIWVDAGPGSFTGIRIGLATARALAFAWNARLRSYSSLALLAAQAHEEAAGDAPLSIAMTGGHGELFWQEFYSDSLAPRAAAISIPIAALATGTEAPVIHGTGAQALVDARGWGEARPLYPDARKALALPDSHLRNGANALYGRGADAIAASTGAAPPSLAPESA